MPKTVLFPGMVDTRLQPINPSPSIDVTIKYNIDTTNTPTCENILANARNSTNKNDFLQMYKIRNSGNDPSLLNVDLKKNIGNFLDDLKLANQESAYFSKPESFNIVDNYLNNDINIQQIPLLRLINSCLKDTYTYNFESLDKQKEQTSESKLRLESVKDPETKVSYYEGWFPLFRPISEPALFGIFAASVFLLLLSIGVFLRMSGFQFNIVLPTLFLASTGSDYSRFIYIGLAVGVAGGIGYYGYTKGWFSKIIGS